MAKKEKAPLEGLAKFNRISKPTNILFSLVFIFAAAAAVLPLILVIIISFSDKNSIMVNGYSFWPTEWSLKSYTTIWDSRASIGRAFLISLFITVAGTALGLLLNATMGYVLSRTQFKFRKFYTYVVFIPMVFYGGLVANYLVVTQFLRIQGTLWSLILPMAVTSFYVIILRTFFTSSVPDSLVESGKIDGASQMRIFFQIVLPIALPGLATIGLFLSFAYWNDWMNALLYMIDVPKLWPLQYVLIRIEQQIEFLIANSTAMGSAAQQMADMPAEGVRMGIVVIAVVPIACSYPFFQRYFISGLTIGAVKG